MIDNKLVQEAVDMTANGASTKDLYTRLFVPKDEFISWFAHGHELVNQGYGRHSPTMLSLEEDIDDFDILCLNLYRGIVEKRWDIKKDIHKLVAESDSPSVAFKYLEAVYRTEFNPKFIDDGENAQVDNDAESSTSYVMESFFEPKPEDEEERKKDAMFPHEVEEDLEDENKTKQSSETTDSEWE